MATEGVWQNITALFSSLIIQGDSKNPSGLSASRTLEGFSRLPETVRIKIWRYSLPGPRLVHKEPPAIDKFVVLGIAETKELNVQDRIEDVMDTSYSARVIYPDLKKVIFVLEKDKIEERLAQTLENKEKKRKIYEVPKGKFGDRIPWICRLFMSQNETQMFHMSS
ncbi:predicted protein [Sclerotinia sclerotiorum 1980 UF-70]|uniref:2EXR domain-containing protein n=1 Tax=Sclerotinia sclerotiorum (strain ATCC 18683 / 1980 / Ss-1) TaxID=665079 RepID=A7EZA0_SCLS1|nr:predicted protein [Sclerotinia sclerotiorum 1980 UF-70]EDN94792.1 predicted protein [Sclerotinia sclerotiorum 1980 UF-70]